MSNTEAITNAARQYNALGSFQPLMPYIKTQVALNNATDELKTCNPIYRGLIQNAIGHLEAARNFLLNTNVHKENEHKRLLHEARQVVIDAIKKDGQIYTPLPVIRPGRCITIDPHGEEMLTMDVKLTESPTEEQLNDTFERWIYVVSNNDACTKRFRAH